MRAIDFSHEITPKNMILKEKFQKIFIFASIHTSISLNQGQGSIFTLRECAQSIFRIILPLYRLFWQKKFSTENDLLSFKKMSKTFRTTQYIPCFLSLFMRFFYLF